jgi:transcriptional regulator with XRE-family HTH domain
VREDPERIARDIGRRIAELRVERDWTQEQFAERLGINVKNLQKLERGRNYTLYKLVGLARVLGVPYVTLLEPPSNAAREMPRGRKAPKKRRRTAA